MCIHAYCNCLGALCDLTVLFLWCWAEAEEERLDNLEGSLEQIEMQLLEKARLQSSARGTRQVSPALGVRGPMS